MEAGKLGIDFPINYPKGGSHSCLNSKNRELK
jgi:hypothetical protein